ncbi:hypothetical protein ACK34J_20875 [Aeromonas veronii]
MDRFSSHSREFGGGAQKIAASDRKNQPEHHNLSIFFTFLLPLAGQTGARISTLGADCHALMAGIC